MNSQKSNRPSANVSPEHLAATVAELSARLDRSERRFRVTVGVLIVAVTVAVSVPALSPVGAQKEVNVTLPPLYCIAALEAKTASMSVLTDPNTKQRTVRFTGVNLQVVNGSSETNGVANSGVANGAGNLIVGYNERRNGAKENTDIRTGSHNLIVGDRHNYESVGGVVLGSQDDNSNQQPRRVPVTS